jgi:hypothetical protein
VAILGAAAAGVGVVVVVLDATLKMKRHFELFNIV